MSARLVNEICWGFLCISIRIRVCCCPFLRRNKCFLQDGTGNDWRYCLYESLSLELSQKCEDPKVSMCHWCLLNCWQSGSCRDANLLNWHRKYACQKFYTKGIFFHVFAPKCLPQHIFYQPIQEQFCFQLEKVPNPWLLIKEFQYFYF